MSRKKKFIEIFQNIEDLENYFRKHSILLMI